MGKLKTEKFSQRLEEMNKYLDYIPIEKSNPKRMAYLQSLPDDEIRSIMGRAIPPEWTVDLLSMGKEPWKFKDVDDQLSTYRQKWQADQQKQIMLKMAGKTPEDQAKVSAKIMSETPTTTIVAATTIPDEEVADEDEDPEAAKEIIMIITIT
jgi:hypothetical protein